jgi:hypothetical protein
MALEGPANSRASLSHDGKEAGSAFMEKREPQFRGYYGIRDGQAMDTPGKRDRNEKERPLRTALFL